MEITLIVSNSNPGVIWNAFRLANIMLEKDDNVAVFLSGPSV